MVKQVHQLPFELLMNLNKILGDIDEIFNLPCSSTTRISL